jgi:hypothetical protein
MTLRVISLMLYCKRAPHFVNQNILKGRFVVGPAVELGFMHSRIDPANVRSSSLPNLLILTTLGVATQQIPGKFVSPEPSFEPQDNHVLIRHSYPNRVLCHGKFSLARCDRFGLLRYR